MEGPVGYSAQFAQHGDGQDSSPPMSSRAGRFE